MIREMELEATITHAALVAEAAKWLRKRCSVVMTELVTSGEVPDAIGWRGTNSFMIECKVSRPDFLAEQRFRHELRLGVGRFRYYLAPSGLLTSEKLPPKWGLLELTNCGICECQKSERFEDIDTQREIGMLLSALRRIGHNAPEGVSIRCYTIPSKNTATLGCQPLDPIDGWLSPEDKAKVRRYVEDTSGHSDPSCFSGAPNPECRKCRILALLDGKEAK